MQFPVEICFLEMDRSTELAREIFVQAKNIEELFDRIERCQVTVEAHPGQGTRRNLYQISVLLSVPNHKLNVESASGDPCMHENPIVAVQCAFEAIRNKLSDYLHEYGIDSKHTSRIPHGLITRICLSDGGPDRPDRGYGFISTCDGREVYFHAKSLRGVEFQRLELGSEVDFVEEYSDIGPKAATVRVVGQ